MEFVQSIDDIDYSKMMQDLITLYFDHNYEEIQQILKIEPSKIYNDTNKNTYKYNKDNGMIFYEDDNPLSTVRIHVDKETRYILNTLLMVTSNFINEKIIIDLMINKWIKNVHVTGLLDDSYPIPLVIGKEMYIQLQVGKKSWDDLSKACKNKDILLKIGFKMTILNYLNEMCSNESAQLK